MPKTVPGVSEVLAGEVRRASRRRLIFWVVAVVVVLVAGGLVWLWTSGAGERQAQRYRTEPATRDNIEVTVVATGALEPTREADISSAITGTVISVEADYNDRVEVGEALAHLDLGDLNNRIARADAVVQGRQASRLTAEANLSDAEAALARISTLVVGQTVSIRDVELANTAVKRAESALALADADLSAANADLAAARRDLDQACICSPIAGVVLAVNVTQGQTLTTSSLGQPLFTVAADLSSLDLQVDIDEADIGQVTQGDTARFIVEAWPDRNFTGEIRQLRYAPVVVDGVVTYRAVLSVDNPELLLRPGMTATADIAVDSVSDVLTVSNAAFRFSPDAAAGGATALGGMLGTSSLEDAARSDRRTLWVLRESQPVAVEVTVGLTDGQRTQIVEGDLAAGDPIIVSLETP